jgi:hypothetical protein
VIAGPDGNVLVVRADGVRIVDQTFKTIQTTPWQRQGIPAPLRVLVTPSRHGFAIDDRKHAALFVGPPYKEAATTTSSVVAGISDSGFMTWSGFNPGPPVLHVNGVEWSAPIHPSLSGLLAIGENEVLGLDQKHTLYRFDQRGDEALVMKLGSLTPGMWNSGFRFEQTLPDAARVLFFSHGARIAFTDSSGAWFYFRTAVLDLKTNNLVFRFNGHLGDDVSISPDGRLVAVREKDLLTIYEVP